MINWWEQPNPCLNPLLARDMHSESEFAPMSADTQHDWRTNDGSRVMMHGVLDMFGSKMITVNTLQQLRGNFEHFRATNITWGNLCGAIGALLSYGDELDMWVSCPHPQLRTNFLDAMEILRDRFNPEDEWVTRSRGG